MLYSICQQIWKTQQWPQDWKRSVFIPIPKNVQTTILLCSLYMLVRLCSKSFKRDFSSTWTGNLKLYKLDLEKAEESETKSPAFIGTQRKQGNARESIYFCLIDHPKAFNCVDHNKLWKILKEMRISDHFTYHLRNLYVGQEATVRTGRRTMNWFKIEKGIQQACTLSTCLFKFYAESIMGNTRLAGWITSWNQEFWEQYQQPQICRGHHPCGRKQRGTNEPLDEGERE